MWSHGELGRRLKNIRKYDFLKGTLPRCNYYVKVFCDGVYDGEVLLVGRGSISIDNSKKDSYKKSSPENHFIGSQKISLKLKVYHHTYPKVFKAHRSTLQLVSWPCLPVWCF